MKSTKLLFLILFATFFCFTPAGNTSTVLVRVDNSLITDVDVDRRVYALGKILSSKMDDANSRRDTVLRDLIREEIKRSTINKTKPASIFDNVDLDYIERSWARSLQVSLDWIKELRRNDKIVDEEIAKVLETESKWQILVRQKVQERRKEPVSEYELNLEIEYLRRFAGETEFFVQEVFIPYQKEDKASQLLRVEELVNQVSSEQLDFNTLVQQESKSITRINGGLAGWLAANQFAPTTVDILLTLGPNEITPLIEKEDGYYLYRLLNRRAVNIAGKRVTLHFISYLLDDRSNEEEKSPVTSVLNKLRHEIGSCVEADKLAKNLDDSRVKSGFIKDVSFDKIDQRTLSAINELQPGETSEPASFGRTVQIFTLCNFSASNEKKELKKIIRQQIVMQGYEAIENEFFNQMQRRTVILFGDEE